MATQNFTRKEHIFLSKLKNKNFQFNLHFENSFCRKVKMKLWPNAFKNLFAEEYCSKRVGRGSPS